MAAGRVAAVQQQPLGVVVLLVTVKKLRKVFGGEGGGDADGQPSPQKAKKRQAKGAKRGFGGKKAGKKR
ncbi:unnamed protein product [Vitrella brassicaformis CCMP3155]|uniref:Uncharacterized protein n=1 Tax=Vitrella brassicaformis (strain CCMP3155) TaxID=1169540 RepID=A0A0G4ECC2_VITBC|nr:unnamed protein product [Vitrella brassicaformis CCMP3155]|eukprot:CEL92989.1 unnamed protein product [Vitrella brassicaformis CCMP3155]